MRLQWPRLRLRSKSTPPTPSDQHSPSPLPPPSKPPPMLTKSQFNRQAAVCWAVSAYHNRQATSPSRSSGSSSPTSRHLDSSISRSTTTIWDDDRGRTNKSRHAHTLPSGGGRPPSLHGLHNNIGDAPASPPIRWDAFNVISVDTAVKLLQGVATHHDVERSVRVVRSWLDSLPRRPDSANAAARIRLAAIQHFSRVWYPSHKEPRTSREDDMEPRVAVARLFGLLLHANVLQSADVALAAEYLFKHRQRTGYMHGLHELLSTAGDTLFQDTSLKRMVTLAKGLEMAKAKAKPCCSFRTSSASSSITKTSEPPSKSEGPLP